MSVYTHTFTVFTATYNRAHTLERAYRSLEAQTFRDFEWLVVDDGSSDETPALMERWQRDPPFTIRYFRQTNRGKHTAMNRGVREARGALFVQLDSDDALVPSALERLHFHWQSIAPSDRASFSAVSGLCRDQNGALVGTEFPHAITDSDALEVTYRFKVTGEKCGFQRTDVLREFPFPETSGFIPEGLVWARIARRYRTRYVNEVLRIYYQDGASLSRGWRPIRSPVGLHMMHRAVLTEQLDYLRFAPLAFLRSAAHYVRFSLHLGVGVGAQSRDIRSARGRLLWGLALPIGGVAYLWDLLRTSYPTRVRVDAT